LLDLGQVREVVGRHNLALHHGEVDLYLVQPGRVHRCVHHDRVREPSGQTLNRCLATVRGPVVDDPEHPIGDRQGTCVGLKSCVGRFRTRVNGSRSSGGTAGLDTWCITTYAAPLGQGPQSKNLEPCLYLALTW
jgi:hypothetical protein